MDSLCDTTELSQHAISDVISPDRPLYRMEPIGEDSLTENSLKSAANSNYCANETSGHLTNTAVDLSEEIITDVITELQTDSLCPVSGDNTNLSMYKCSTTSSTGDSDSNYLSQHLDTGSYGLSSTLSQHCEDSTRLRNTTASPLSQNHDSDAVFSKLSPEIGYSDLRHSGGSSNDDTLAMFASRPNTVIEKPTGSFENLPTSKGQPAVSNIFMSSVDRLLKQGLDETSVAYAHEDLSQRVSIGDTVVHAGKDPIRASTPCFAREAKFLPLVPDGDVEVLDRSDSGRASSPASGELGGTRSEKEMREMLQNLSLDRDAYIEASERMKLVDGMGQGDNSVPQSQQFELGGHDRKEDEEAFGRSHLLDDQTKSSQILDYQDNTVTEFSGAREDLSFTGFDSKDAEQTSWKPSMFTTDGVVPDVHSINQLHEQEELKGLEYFVNQVVTDESDDGESTKVNQGRPSSVNSVHSNGSGKGSELDDVDRITHEYRSILRDHVDELEGVGNRTQQTDVASDTETDVPQEAIPTKTKTEARKSKESSQPDDQWNNKSSDRYLELSSRSRYSSGSETEDALDRDVQRLLAKYDRSLSGTDDESHDSHRVAPLGLAISNDSTESVGSAQEKQPTPHFEFKPLASYLYDDPANSMSLPHLGDSASVSEASPKPTTVDVEPENLKHSDVSDDSEKRVGRKKPVEASLGERRRHDESSEDELGKKVADILTSTDYMPAVGETAHDEVGSTISSHAGSIDYGTLQKDLEEIQLNLETARSKGPKSGDLSGRLSPESNASGKSSHISSGSEKFMTSGSAVNASKITITSTVSDYGTPRKYTWDHGADLGGNPDGRFVSGYRSSTESRKDQDLAGNPDGRFVTGHRASTESRKYSDLAGNPDGRFVTGHRASTESRKDQETGDAANLSLLDLGVDPILTSGIVPMDVALDIVHGSHYISSGRPKYTLDTSYLTSTDSPAKTGECIAKENKGGRSKDEDSLLDKEVEDTYVRPSMDNSNQSFSERIQEILERESPPRQAYSYLEEAADEEDQLRRKMKERKKQDLTTASYLLDPRKTKESSSMQLIPLDNSSTYLKEDSSFDFSPLTKHTPFNKFNNVRSIFSSQLDKATTKVFTMDESLDFASPSKNKSDSRIHAQALPDNRSAAVERPLLPVRSKLRPTERRLSPIGDQLEDNHGVVRFSEQLVEPASGQVKAAVPASLRQEGQYEGDSLDREIRRRILEDQQRRERLEGREERKPESQQQADMRQYTAVMPPDRRPLAGGGSTSDVRARSPTPPPSEPVVSGGDNREDAPRFYTPHLVPYRPGGGRDVYYVEVDDASVTALSEATVESGHHSEAATESGYPSEATVESTHPGSDDARGPVFPSQVLGSRSDPTFPSTGIYTKELTRTGMSLSTIQEHNARSNSDHDSAGDGGPGKSDDSDKKSSDKERSFKKIEEWVNGNFGGSGSVGERSLMDDELSEHTPIYQKPPNLVEDQLSPDRPQWDSDFGTPQKSSVSFDDSSLMKKDEKSEAMSSFNLDSAPMVVEGVTTTGSSSGTKLQGGSGESPFESKIAELREAVFQRHGYPRTESLHRDHSSEPALYTDYSTTRPEQFQPLVSDQSVSDVLGDTRASSRQDLSADTVNTDDLLTLVDIPPPRLFANDPQDSSHPADSTAKDADSSPGLPAGIRASAASPEIFKDLPGKLGAPSLEKTNPPLEKDKTLAGLSSASTGRDKIGEVSSTDLLEDARRKEVRELEYRRLMRRAEEISAGRNSPVETDVNAVWERFQQRQARRSGGSSGEESSMELSGPRSNRALYSTRSLLHSGRRDDQMERASEQIQSHRRDRRSDPRDGGLDARSRKLGERLSMLEQQDKKSYVGERGSEQTNGRGFVLDLSRGEGQTRKGEGRTRAGEGQGDVGSRQKENEMGKEKTGSGQARNELGHGRSMVQKKSFPGDNSSSDEQRGKTSAKKLPDDALEVQERTSSRTKDKDRTTGRTQESDPPKGDGSKDHLKPRKLAWVIEDETLASVPEDSTLDSVSSDFATSSEIDNEGKLVMRTSKRHLPNDPKLLRLQRKIALQKEKYKREKLRELNRKDKIRLMERELREKGKAYRQEMQEPRRRSAGKATSTPSKPLMSSDSTTPTLSDITTSTVTVTEESTITSFEAGDSNVRHRRPEERKSREEVVPPSEFKLQTVDYSRRSAERKKSQSPQKKPASSKQAVTETEAQRQRTKSKNKTAKDEMVMIRDGGNVDVYFKQPGKNEFGATFPSPVPFSNLSNVDYKQISMISKGVQTLNAENEDDKRRRPTSLLISPPPRVASPKKSREKAGLGLNAQENIPEKTKSSKSKKKRVPVKAGVAWFLPLDEPRPWRKPLRERQHFSQPPAHPPSQPTTQPASQPTTKPASTLKSTDSLHTKLDRVDESLVTELANKMSLQEAFMQHRQSFIWRSRDRQRHVKLRAEQRRRQEAYLLPPSPRPRPRPRTRSEDLFRPKHRFMTKKEMRELTAKRVKRLPEVVKAEEDRKRKEFYKTNLLRAKLYKQYVLRKVLSGKHSR